MTCPLPESIEREIALVCIGVSMKTNLTNRISRVECLALGMMAAVLVAQPCAAEDNAPSGDAASTVIAKYQNTEFTEADLATAVGRLNTRARRTLSDNPERMRQFVENHIVSELIYAEGKAKNYDADPEIRQQLTELERHLVVQRVMQEQQATPIDDAVVRAYYDEHPDEFSSDRLQASHILVAEEELAREVHAKLVEDPSKFTELAAEHSVDRSNAQRGGDLGLFGKGRMVKEFEQIAFAMIEDEQLSEPLQTRFGWHIIKRTAREDGSAKAFEEVQNQIKVRLVSERRRERTKNFLEKLKSDAGLVVNDDVLAAIELAPKKDDDADEGKGAKAAKAARAGGH
ncbi:MAG: peptidyl-prolyl cis-trans isomerase C [Hyphomicrobiaceae bacterium]